jgi:predicted GNAT family acetyltransferase
VRFIRKNGRVIPIHEKGDKRKERPSRAAGAAVAAGGAAVAADAARTTQLYRDGSITVIKKRFAFQPMANTFGTSLHMYKRQGPSSYLGPDLHNPAKRVQAAKVFFYKTGDRAGKEFSISWLSTAKKFRGQGLSKDIMKHASNEMRAQGGTSLWSHVVHPNSAGLGKKRGTFWKEMPGDMVTPVSERTALKHVTKWAQELKAKPSLFSTEGLKAGVRSLLWHKGKDKSEAAAIFREVRIPKFSSIAHAPTRTFSNKLAIGVGLATLAGGLYHAFRKPSGKRN